LDGKTKPPFATENGGFPLLCGVILIKTIQVFLCKSTHHLSSKIIRALSAAHPPYYQAAFGFLDCRTYENYLLLPDLLLSIQCEKINKKSSPRTQP